MAFSCKNKYFCHTLYVRLPLPNIPCSLVAGFRGIAKHILLFYELRIQFRNFNHNRRIMFSIRKEYREAVSMSKTAIVFRLWNEPEPKSFSWPALPSFHLVLKLSRMPFAHMKKQYTEFVIFYSRSISTFFFRFAPGFLFSVPCTVF